MEKDLLRRNGNNNNNNNLHNNNITTTAHNNRTADAWFVRTNTPIATINNNISHSETIRQQQSSTTSSSDFVLQWGNRKRLRCMKVQQANKDNNKADPSGPPHHRATVRVDRRVVRPDNNNKDATTAAANHTASNGYLNLRQRPSSPSPALPHRVLRNSENSSAMRNQNNGGGVRGLVVASPDKERRAGSHHHSNRNGSNNHESNNNNNNKSGQSPETTHDSKKGGSSSGGSGEAAPVVWPPKFVIALTNKEKEEDFIAFKGSKLPHRPKKRAKYIQRTLNLVMPGGWLCDLTLERYEVREKKTSKKRPRGLKAMGNMDSDSE